MFGIVVPLPYQILGAVGFLSLAYGGGFLEGKHLEANSSAREQLVKEKADLQATIVTMKEAGDERDKAIAKLTIASTDANTRADAAEQAVKTLEGERDVYVDGLPGKGPTCGLTDADVRGLRSIGAAKPKPGPVALPHFNAAPATAR